jgi:hypothetical protein
MYKTAERWPIMSSALATLTSICSLCLQTGYFPHVLTMTLVILCVLWGSLDFSLACNLADLCMERFVQICWWSGSLGCRVGHASPERTQVQANETKVYTSFLSNLGVVKEVVPSVPSSFMHRVPIYFLLCSWSFHCCLNLYPHALSKMIPIITYLIPIITCFKQSCERNG